MSFIADPTPALPSGTDDMIDPVIDGMASAIPAAITITTGMIWMYAVPVPAKVNNAIAAATPSRPTATTRLTP